MERKDSNRNRREHNKEGEEEEYGNKGTQEMTRHQSWSMECTAWHVLLQARPSADDDMHVLSFNRDLFGMGGQQQGGKRKGPDFRMDFPGKHAMWHAHVVLVPVSIAATHVLRHLCVSCRNVCGCVCCCCYLFVCACALPSHPVRLLILF